MLGALARSLERRGVFDAERKLKSTLMKILLLTTLMGVLAYITKFYVVLIFVPIAAILLVLSLFSTGRDYGLINRESVLFALHGFILANAGFDVTGIFDKLAKMLEYEGSYVFRKIMGYFYFMGMDLREAINIVLAEEKKLGMSFKSFLTSVYNGMTTGIDTRSIFSMIIQQEIVESQKNIEAFEQTITSFLSGLMPFVVMTPMMLVLMGSVANMTFYHFAFLNIALGISVGLLLLFSENKFLYYPEIIMFSGRILVIQSIIALAVGVALYYMIGTYSLFVAVTVFYVVGYLMTRNYVGIRKDTYQYLPVFLADLGGRISIGQTFTEAVTNMPLDIYGKFSKVLKYSLGNLLHIGEIPPRKEFDRIYVYKIYKKLISDLQKGVYGYEALLNVRSIVSLMSAVYEKVRGTLGINMILIAVSLAFSTLFVDLLAFLGQQVAAAMKNVKQAQTGVAGGMQSLLILLTFLQTQSWVVDVYFLFAAIFMIVMGSFVSSVTDGTRHGNIHSILYCILSSILIVIMHTLVAPLLIGVYS